MSIAEHPLLKLDRLSLASDWLNPILVKETRQAFQSRTFVVTFLLLVFCAWLATLFGLLFTGDMLEYRSAGREFFAAYYFVLCVAAIVVVPFGAFRGLLNERDYQTYELLSISTLKPGQIVWGKLNAAMLQIFTFLSAIAPFMAFTSLLEGFDLAQVAFSLYVLMMTSLVCCLFGLMLSTLARQRHWQALLSLCFIGFLVMVLFYYCVVSAFWMANPLPVDQAEFWWFFVWFSVFAISYLAVFHQIAVAQLTFDSDNRSTGLRVTATVQFWLMVLMCVLDLQMMHHFGSWKSGIDDPIFAVTSVVGGLHWTAIGLFMIAEPDTLSTRIRRRVPRSRFWRLLLAPFLPGASRGLVLLIAHLLVVPALYGIAMQLGMKGRLGSGRVDEKLVVFMLAFACYVWMYLGAGAVIGRFCRRNFPETSSAQVRVLTLVLFAMGSILPFFPVVFFALQNREWEYPPMFITNPFYTLGKMSQNYYENHYLFGMVACLALLVLVVNLRAMFSGLVQVLTIREVPLPAPPRPESSVNESLATPPENPEASHDRLPHES